MCENVVVFLQNVVMFCFVFQEKIWDIIVDKENSMLISVGVLFKAPINVKDHNSYDDDFKNYQLYRFLNKEFKKDLLLNYDMPNQKTLHL